MSGVKDLFRKYGKVAVGVHLTVYAASFAGATTKTAWLRLLPCIISCLFESG